jgi:glutamyl-tRNA synthetase
VRPNVLFPADAREWAERIFSDGLIAVFAKAEDKADREPLWARWPEAEAAAIRNAGLPFFEAALAALEPDMDFDAFAQRVKSATGRKGKDLFQPLRASLTGLLHGPEMHKLFPLIGESRVRTRFEHARAKAIA